MSKTKVHFCFALLLSVAALSRGFAADRVEIRLRSAATCPTSIVRLGDVAEVIAVDASLVRALTETSLCPTPAVGSGRTLSRSDVRELLALSGAGKTDFQFTGGETVSVTAGTAPRPAASKRPMAISAVRQAIFETVATTPRPADVRPATAALPVQDAREPSSAVLVERGTTVSVHANTAGIRVSTYGKALDAGASGQTINVELADSKQRVQARIVGPQLVEVAVGATSAVP